MGCVTSKQLDHESRRRDSTGSLVAALAKEAPTPVCSEAAKPPSASLESDGFSFQPSSKKASYVSQMGNHFATQERMSGEDLQLETLRSVLSTEETSSDRIKFSKRAGTSGIRGQLYESKLLSLIYFRASFDDNIEDFQIVSNIDNIGAFDDICLKVKLKGHDKPVAVFIQAKHKETERRPLTYDLAVYFDSYLKIRNAFKKSSKDDFFSGEFAETECLFVIYTNAPVKFNYESVECNLPSHVHDVIETGGVAKQPYRQAGDIMHSLHKTFLKHQMTALAERIAKFFNNSQTDSDNKHNVQNMMLDTLVQTYHVILAQTIFDVSEIIPPRVESKLYKGKVKNTEFPRHRIATFRSDFFYMNDEYLTLFKQKLMKEVLKQRKIKSTDVKTFLSEYLAEPTDPTRLSKLIGTVITYNNGHLKYCNEKASTRDYRPQLSQVNIAISVVNEAVELAAREILLSRELKVPVAFGNKDLTVSKINRIDYLASKIKELVDNCGSSNLVTIDDSLGKGFLQLNGGIASAIGNVFVLDTDSKLTKITNNKEALGELAKKLYERLNEEIPNLLKLKFRFQVTVFPKLLLECTEYEENFTKDFFDKLIIYSDQADEEGVEKILKSEVEEYQREQPNYLQVHTDAIYAKYHDDMQKWWMQSERVLTRTSGLFKKAKESIIKNPLLSVINAMNWNDLRHIIDYKFTDDTVSALNLQDQNSSSVIVTAHSVLTVLKVRQHLMTKDLILLNLKYIFKLPPKDCNVLLQELKDINEVKVLILVCDAVQQYKKKILENIAPIVRNKQYIIITNLAMVVVLQKHFSTPPVHDENTSLINLTERSQKSILESARVKFQGAKVNFSLILDDKSKKYVKGDILDKIISEEEITVGKLIVKTNYEEIKDLYVDRRVTKRDKIQVDVKTFLDISDNVVLITAAPGMGKSTLLTHLSIQTKEIKPELWIVRINLLEYAADLNKWESDKTDIDLLATLKFICQVIVQHKLGKENKVSFTLEEKNNIVYLKTCVADPMTELELNLFLHFYCEREIIFVIDGFDEIGPHYTDLVMKFLKTIKNNLRKHRMWVTSRPYSRIKAILEEGFEIISYDIERLSYKEMLQYLQTFWKYNLTGEEFDSITYEHYINNLKMASKDFTNDLLYSTNPENSILNFEFTKNALLFVTYKRKDMDIHKKITYDMFNKEICDLCHCCYCVASCPHGNSDADSLTSGTPWDINPLFMYLAADYITDILKNSRDFLRCFYYRDVYDIFLRSLLKRQYHGKNGMKTSNPVMRQIYEKEIASIKLKLKKLAHYSLFSESSHILYAQEDLVEIKELIGVVEKGEEPNEVIEGVANGIPIFVHRSFAEYLAVEYICDCLKDETKCVNQKLAYFVTIFSDVGYYENVRLLFQKKMYYDCSLVDYLKNMNDVIFKWLLNTDEVFYQKLAMKLKNESLCKIRSYFTNLFSDAKIELSESDDKKWSAIGFHTKIVKNRES